MLLWPFEKLFLTSDTIKVSDIDEDFVWKFVFWKDNLLETMVTLRESKHQAVLVASFAP